MARAVRNLHSFSQRAQAHAAQLLPSLLVSHEGKLFVDVDDCYDVKLRDASKSSVPQHLDHVGILHLRNTANAVSAGESLQPSKLKPNLTDCSVRVLLLLSMPLPAKTSPACQPCSPGAFRLWCRAPAVPHALSNSVMT